MKLASSLLLLALVTWASPLSASTPKKIEPKVLWRVDLSSDSKGSGAIADIDGDGKPEIVFGTYFRDRHVYALNGEDGSLCWKYLSDRGPMDASVLIIDHDGDGDLETLSADSSSGRLFCLDSEGNLTWAYKLPNSTDSPPAAADLDSDGDLEIIAGSMWKQDGQGDVTCFDAGTQETLWSAAIPGCVQSEPVLVEIDGIPGLDVVVTSWRGDRGVHALSGLTGETLWRFETDGDDKSMGMYHGVTVIEEEGQTRLVVATTEGDVYGLDLEGVELWHKDFDEYIFAPTSAADLDGDGAIDVCVCAATIRVLRASDGEEIWSRKHSSSSSRGAAIADVDGDRNLDIVYASGTVLYAVSGRDGKELGHIDIRTEANDPAEGIAGVLLSDLDGDDYIEAFCVVGRGHYGGENKGEGNHGQAVAVRLGKGKKGTWETFRGNSRRTGTHETTRADESRERR